MTRPHELEQPNTEPANVRVCNELRLSMPIGNIMVRQKFAFVKSVHLAGPRKYMSTDNEQPMTHM